MPRGSSASARRRFRPPLLAALQIAAGVRRSAVMSSSQSGVFQTYAIDLDTGAMRQLTNADAGTVLAYLAEDGRSLLTLEDEGGNEVGHWVSIPVQGGDRTDLTPDMQAYSSWTVAADRAGTQVAIAITTDDGTEIVVVSPSGASAPRRLGGMRGLVLALAFSADR